MFGRIAAEVGVREPQVAAVARLLGEGNTVPFIARYRKEAHGNLDEVQILKIQERVAYYGELEERRATIIKSIDEQGKLTDSLRDKIEKCMESRYSMPCQMPDTKKTAMVFSALRSAPLRLPPKGMYTYLRNQAPKVICHRRQNSAMDSDR